ncbi:MAG TPA: FUSC family protein [Acidimicrobiales bacterium]
MEAVTTPPSLSLTPAIETGQRSRSEWLDRSLGSDPGLNRFRNALHSVLAIGLTIAAESLFVRLTHALQVPVTGRRTAAQAAAAAGANHEYLVIADLLGAIVAMLSTLMISDTRARGQLMSMALLPCAMIPALAFGIEMGGYRVPALTLLAVILAAGTYLRRFGSRGFTGGNVLFMGYFIGFFLHAGVSLSDMGWLSAEVGVGVLVSTAVRFTVFYPRPSEALHRTLRSYNERARKIAASSLALFEDSTHRLRDVRRLHRQLVRLNEAGLMIDAQLGDSSAVPDGSSGQLLHQRLFDVELALTNVARFAQALAQLDLPFDQRTEILLTLRAIVNSDAQKAEIHAHALMTLVCDGSSTSTANDTTTIIARRFASSVLDLIDAGTQWRDLGRSDAGPETFQPAVALLNGWLPGSAQISAVASRERGIGWTDRVRLAPYTRVAIQMGVAVGLAITLGVQVSSYRFYWAVIAAFVTFMGANSSGEQVRKGFFRVAGTVAGIFIGSLFVDAVGHDPYASIAVILGALFFGIYLLRVNYAFMVVGITIMVSQLYQQLDEFSNSLLLLRLEETAVGAACAMIVALTVLPLRTRRVLHVGMRDLVESVGDLVEHASDHLLGEDHDFGTSMRADARAVDAAYQAVIATAQPLRRSIVGKIDGDIASALVLAAAARNYSRNLVADADAATPLDIKDRQQFQNASWTLLSSIEVIGIAVTGVNAGVYARSSSLFERVEQDLEQSSTGDIDLALRDFKLIDGVMARLAEMMSLRIGDFDTAETG